MWKTLIFSSISIPINMFKSFNIDNIYNLAETSYSQDFIKKKKLIWYFNYNIIILICQAWMKFYKQFIYFIFTHIYYVNFLRECLFFIWVYLDRIYSSPLNIRFLAPPLKTSGYLTVDYYKVYFKWNSIIKLSKS